MSLNRSDIGKGVLVAMAASALFAVGCSLVVSFDESQIPQDTDGGTDAEADSAIDTGSPDSGEVDSGTTDSGEMDSTMTDSGGDTTPGDTGMVDSTGDVPVDSGSDSAPVDSGTDSASTDSGTDTGTDTGSATDTGSDTGMDMDAMDMGVMDSGAMDMGSDASSGLATFAGCTLADYAANDFSGASSTPAEITFPTGGLAYSPKCIRVKAGQTVTWTASGVTFADHPLRHAPTNPDATKIPNQDTGTTFSETFSVTGFYGYYCAFHGSPTSTGGDMSGSIQVVP